MSKRLVIVLVVLLSILAACGSQSGGGLLSQTSSSNQQAAPLAPVDTSGLVVSQMATPRPATTDTDGTTPQRVILRTASLSIVVDDPETTFTSITSLTEEMGGWVVNSNTNRVKLASPFG
ncbi:MAG TPA: hypothetical protein VHO69_03985 [Phototrophicaceae bacterium]|nr:hypothetical protein [Phototrophicaceae bacterium]